MIRSLFVFAFLMSGLLAHAQVTGLSFRPVDASYSVSMDRIIFVASNPNALHIYNPVSNVDQVVALSETPLGVSLSPDGTHAAVAHSDAVSYVDLKAGTVLQKFANIQVGTGQVILGSGYIYLIGNSSAINVVTGVITTSSIFGYSFGVVDAASNSIYVLGSFGLSKVDTSGGTLGTVTSEPSDYFGTFNVCSPLWLSRDSAAIYSGCGNTFRASADPTRDMRYTGTLSGLTQGGIQNLATSDVLKQVALIPKVQSYGTVNTSVDTVLNLYDSNSFNLTGQLATTPFVVNGGSFAAHGRWVFYNAASSSAFLVTQADSTAGLEQDYAVENVKLSAPNSCNATFGGSSASAIAPGGYGTVAISSGEDCAFTAISNTPWITLASGYYGSGPTTLTYLVRPNLSSVSRSGTITMGAQTFTVNQDAAVTPTTWNSLSFKPIAADYDKPFDKIVMVSASPSELHIYDPVTQADQIVPLPYAPLSVSVRPDGLFAAVGHSGEISIVDLQANAVTQTIPVDMDNGGILLASNGYAYAFPAQTNSFAGINSVNLLTGTATTLLDVNYGNIPRLDVSGNYIYVGSNGGSKLNIINGPATLALSPGALYGNIWLSEDGNRLFSSSGRVFFTSAIPSQDLQSGGSLSGSTTVDWAANSQVQHQTAILTDPTSATNTQLQLYADNGLQLLSQATLPGFSNNGSSYISHGRYLFWNSSATKLFAVLEADSTSGLLSDFAVYNVNAPQSLAGCTYSLSPSVLSFGPVNTSGSFNVVSNCDWQAVVGTSNVLFLLNNGVYGGNGQVTFELLSNSGAARSTTISVGNQVVTVNQAAASCIYSLSSTQQTFTQLGGTGTFNLTTGPSCPWSIQNGASWLTVAGNPSGTGSATFQFQVAADNDTSFYYRVAALNVAGYFLNVSQIAVANPPTGVTLITTQTPGPVRNDYSGYVGFKFTVGSNPIQVTALGRFGALFNGSGSYLAHAVKLVQASGVDVPNGSVSVAMNGVNGAYQYASLKSPVTLLANTSYYLVSQETSGGDYWYDIGPVTTSSVAAVVAPTYTDAAGRYYPVAGLAGQSYVPLNFLYSTVASTTPSLSVTITSPQTGATISSNTAVTVTTTGSVANLQLQVDGLNQGAVNALTLNPSSLTNGSHVLTVVASDAQSNSVTSAPVTVNVSTPAVANTTTFVTAQSLTVLRNNYSGYVGFSFTTGSSAITVTSLGRYVAASNNGNHILKLVNSDGSDVAGGSATISLSGATAGQYSYASLAAGITLQANTTYYLMSQETAGADQWYDIGYVTTTGAANVNAPVYTDAAGRYYPVKGLTGQSYGPLSFGYQPATSGTPAAAMTSFLTGETLGRLRNDYTGYVGMAFQVGSKPISVTALGSLSVSAPGTTANLTLKLVNTDGTDFTGGSVSILPGSGTVGQFNYILLNQPVTLAANTTYILVSQETTGAGQWYDLGPVTSTGVAQILGAVYTDGNGKYYTVGGTQNYSYVPVSFLYQ